MLELAGYTPVTGRPRTPADIMHALPHVAAPSAPKFSDSITQTRSTTAWKDSAPQSTRCGVLTTFGGHNMNIPETLATRFCTSSHETKSLDKQ